MDKCTVRTMKMTMLALAAAFASGAASAANYYRMAALNCDGDCPRGSFARFYWR